MNKSTTSIYFIVGIALVGGIIINQILTSVFGEDMSYSQVTFMLFGLTALVFGVWYLFVHRVKSPSLTKLDEAYRQNHTGKKKKGDEGRVIRTEAPKKPTVRPGERNGPGCRSLYRQ